MQVICYRQFSSFLFSFYPFAGIVLLLTSCLFLFVSYNVFYPVLMYQILLFGKYVVVVVVVVVVVADMVVAVGLVCVGIGIVILCHVLDVVVVDAVGVVVDHDVLFPFQFSSKVLQQDGLLCVPVETLLFQDNTVEFLTVVVLLQG